MISNREMFCVIFGAISTTPVSKDYSNSMLDQARKEFGLTKSEANKILKELDNTLEFIVEQMKKKVLNIQDKKFDV